MSDRASGYIREIRVCPNGERISAMEKYAALILADNHQGRAERRTYPSVRSMAEDALVSERTFQRMLAELERKGVIRREYPDGIGRGKLTYYYFPELDERALKAVESSEKGRQVDTLFLQKGCQKGDRRVTKTGSPILSNKYNKSNEELFPPTPASGDDGDRELALAVKQPAEGDALDRAVDQVMFGCGFVRRRLRRVLRDAIQRRCDLGELAPTVALAMIEAWKSALLFESQGVLRCRSGPEKFFGDSEWCANGGLRFDERALEKRRNAHVGVV